MANYYDREEDRYRDERRYGRSGGGNDRGQKYGEAYERDRGWGVGNEGGYGTGWGDDYDRGYGSRYYTGDEQGRGFAGGRDLGARSYRSSYDRDWNETPASFAIGMKRPHQRPAIRETMAGATVRPVLTIVTGASLNVIIRGPIAHRIMVVTFKQTSVETINGTN